MSASVRRFQQLENSFLPFNRFVSHSKDLAYWGKHRHVMGPKKERGLVNWQMTKIGAGPYPIETNEGWLLFITASSPPVTASPTAWARRSSISRNLGCR